MRVDLAGLLLQAERHRHMGLFVHNPLLMHLTYGSDTVPIKGSSASNMP